MTISSQILFTVEIWTGAEMCASGQQKSSVSLKAHGANRLVGKTAVTISSPYTQCYVSVYLCVRKLCARASRFLKNRTRLVEKKCDWRHNACSPSSPHFFPHAVATYLPPELCGREKRTRGDQTSHCSCCLPRRRERGQSPLGARRTSSQRASTTLLFPRTGQKDW